MSKKRAPPSSDVSKTITCEECKYWVMETDMYGRCHRHAPSPSSDLRYRELTKCCPVTKKYYWCGDAEERK